jgi:hypothetical protein
MMSPTRSVAKKHNSDTTFFEKTNSLSAEVDAIGPTTIGAAVSAAAADNDEEEEEEEEEEEDDEDGKEAEGTVRARGLVCAAGSRVRPATSSMASSSSSSLLSSSSSSSARSALPLPLPGNRNHKRTCACPVTCARVEPPAVYREWNVQANGSKSINSDDRGQHGRGKSIRVPSDVGCKNWFLVHE